jgi:EPS-associated MarR family transcriptional regulator
MAEDHNLKVLRLLQENPHLSQREASDVLGLSLGKTNYVINALIEKGLIKINNFKNNKNKSSYAYLLTPQGIEEKARLTLHFFEVKRVEYEELKREVEKLGLDHKNASLESPSELGLESQ